MNITLFLTWTLQSWHKGYCTASAHHHSLWQTAQCECHPVRGTHAVVASLRDCSLTWRRIRKFRCIDHENDYNHPIIAPFHHERTNFFSICYFGSLIRFAHFMIMLGEELPSLPPLTARHWFFIIQIFEQLSCSEKQSCPETFYCVWIFFYLFSLLGNLWPAQKNSVPWVHCIKYIDF